LTPNIFTLLFHQINFVMNILFKLAFFILFPLLFVFGVALEFPRSSQGAANIAFKSTDGGETWQDISKGLPENLRANSIRGNQFFANDKGLFLQVVNGLYHSAPNATAPFWKKEIPGKPGSIARDKPGIFAYNYWGINLKKRNGTGVWSRIFEDQEPRNSSAFEIAGGTIFISTELGLFKSANSGKTWKHVYAGDWVRNMAEQNGVLMATTNMRRLIRSTDNGESWALMNSEGDTTWDVKEIKGGFVAITSSSASGTRRLRTSCDSGKTWQPIDASLQDKIQRTWNNDRLRVQAFNISIIQVGENFLCAHPDGIFRSPDKGKTWKLLLPSIDKKVFNLFFSGNVIYAIRTKGGC